MSVCKQSDEVKAEDDPAPGAPDPALLLQCFQQADLGTAIFDARAHTIRWVNPTFARDRGYRPEEMRGLSVDALYPADLVAVRRVARQAIDANARIVVETEQVTKHGRRFPVRLNCTVLRDARGLPETVIVYAEDITDERRATHGLQLAAAAFETAQPMAVLDARHRILQVNGAFTGLTGYRPAEAVGRIFPLLHGNRDDAELRRWWDTVDTAGHWQGEEWIRTKEGEPRIVLRAISAVRDPAGHVTHYVGSLHDLTRERGALSDLDRMTFSDALTGLPNRAFLCSQLRQELADTAGHAARVLMLADLDHFKRINELYGHATGDALLRQAARRLQQYQGHGGLVCRLEGDTFAWFASTAGDEDGKAIADRLRALLPAEPFELANGASVILTASVGWVELTPAFTDPDMLLEAGELALQEARATGGAERTRRYTPELCRRKRHRELLIQELQAALAGDGLALYPQLQVDHKGNPVGAEVLLRWTRPNGEPVEPDVFIPLAAQGQLLEALDGWVLDHTCALLADWAQKPLLADFTLAANVSAWRFQQPGFVASLRRRLARTGVDPRRLQLEITESAALGDFDTASDKLRRLRELGVRVSLDDFGIGYSSMSYLTHLPLDQLKIDKSFVAQVPLHSANTVLVESIIAMAHGFELEVVAEGVETHAQQTFLRAHGCDVFQGYLYAPPMTVAQVEAMVTADATTGQRARTRHSTAA